MGRKILFITTDQQRFDSLGCNGGAVARTPVVDGLAAAGVNFTRAHPQSVVCMPSRSTMITGQHVSTHGVWMNGVPLPLDAPSVATLLHDNGYATALFGKAHFEPYLDLSFRENRMARDGDVGPHRGFDHLELATHGPAITQHYGAWLAAHAPDAMGGFYSVMDATLHVNALGGGDTGAPQAWRTNDISRDLYHTDWVAERAIAWLDSLDADADWFCWVSFPDPHHPWDPPSAELGRVDWRDLDLPAGYPADRAERERLLDGKPRHWRLWYDGDVVTNFEVPPAWVPATMTADQVREVNALVHVENELIDEAVGRVVAHVSERGWLDDTDVFFTTDHGELQGDFGLLFKGPYHVDALMRLPFVWCPAPSAAVAPAVVSRPVGHVDLAPTFCAIAGIDAPDWMEGEVLPLSDGEAEAAGSHERVLTEWESEHERGDVYLRSIYRDGFMCTTCEKGSFHDGSEGELYDVGVDPLQRDNLWGDPARRALRDDLVADLYDNLPAPRVPRLDCVAPV
jgi:arylsulfatase A-like enzyme